MIFEYLIHILILVGIYTILALSLNLALGYSGLLNLAHVSLFGIGAYTSVLLNMQGFPFVLSIIASGIVSALFGFILVFSTKKLKGDYYALASLGFAFVVYSLLLNLISITRGPLGISGIPRPSIFSFVINDNFTYLIFVLLFLLITLILFSKVVRSPFGKLLEAMRDDELSLRILGKNTYRLKYKSMSISAFFAGLAGSLFAHYIGYIDPNMFYINEIILIISIVIVGGAASLRGSVVATVIIIFLSELLRFIHLPSSIVGPGRQIIYSIILLLILMKKPRGLFGRIDLE
ncbi:MAG: branched-chain amino acid ABC transporter permease [Nanoarchaeota archaeon]